MRTTAVASIALLYGAGTMNQVFAQSAGVSAGVTGTGYAYYAGGYGFNQTSILTGTGAPLSTIKSIDLKKISVPTPSKPATTLAKTTKSSG